MMIDCLFWMLYGRRLMLKAPAMFYLTEHGHRVIVGEASKEVKKRRTS